VPDAAEAPTQVVDVRDLAAWLVDAGERGLTGTYDAIGPTVSLAEWIALSREIGGHIAETVPVASDWLVEQGVEEFMGPESLTMWIVDPDWAAFTGRSGRAAAMSGLRNRPRRDLVVDLLSWERELGLERERRAGLSAARERELLDAWADHRAAVGRRHQ